MGTQWIVRLFILLLIILGVYFRADNLFWGAPFFFHPDERNIASSISQLWFPNQLNPHFFAYGSFPIYMIYTAGFAINFFVSFIHHASNQLSQVSFENAIEIGRMYSLLFSIFLLPLIYMIGTYLEGENVGRIATILSLFSVGFIQYAHFATFEMWLTFFTTLLFFFFLLYLKTNQLRYITIAVFVLGLLYSVKVSSFALLLPFFLLSLQMLFRKNGKNSRKSAFVILLLSLLVPVIIFLILCPFNILDYSAFRSSITYESTVALGRLPVFYTQAFLDTIPILFQIIHEYPFLINPVNFVLFLIFFPVVFWIFIREKNAPLGYLLLFFLITFIPEATLFVKWTRYLVPSLPFLYLLLGIGIKRITEKKENFFPIISLLLTIIGFVFSVSFVITVYQKPETPLLARDFAKTHIPQNARILSEVYDLGIVPFNAYFPHITLFDFYSLDQNPALQNNLSVALNNADYIILPSQRILKSRVLNPSRFPVGSSFYTNLLNGSLGFSKIYQTPCDIFCTIAYMGSPVFSNEETVNVFDHPEVYVFEKDETIK